MKQMIAVFIGLLLLTGICYAEGGDPNIDGGGGGMGGGTGESYWTPGNDGVRATIIQSGAPVAILDYANRDYSTEVTQSFKVRCKLSYMAGTSLSPAVIYKNFIPSGVKLPVIISKNGGSTIAAIRDYFTDEQVVRNIAQDSGISFLELTNGSYKLTLEPIAYFKFKGVMYAMTATEAALYDEIVNGDLKLWMGTLTHQNQPFSMFLERSDLGIAPWLGGTVGKQDNSTIKHQLGVGIVSFRYTEEEEPVEPENPGGGIDPDNPGDGTGGGSSSGSDYNNSTYRTDTDVITSVLVRNNRAYGITPDDDAYITFSILGKTYRKQYVCPSGSSQLVWVRWHTPTTPQDTTIRVTGSGVNQTLNVSIGDLPERTPPNPVYDGPGIGAGQYQPNFRLDTEPSWGSETTATWRQWYPTWHPPRKVGMVTRPGYWSFSILEYGATLTVDYDLAPSSRNPTAEGQNGQYTVKAGYGIEAKCTVRVSGIGGATNNDIIAAQNAIAVFPDWKFKTYNRVLEPETRGSYNTKWHFRENPYSYYSDRVHFIPLWYPTATKYPVPVAVFDVWTPAGQLYTSVSDYVDVSGDMYDDWYIRVIDR